MHACNAACMQCRPTLAGHRTLRLLPLPLPLPLPPPRRCRRRTGVSSRLQGFSGPRYWQDRRCTGVCCREAGDSQIALPFFQFQSKDDLQNCASSPSRANGRLEVHTGLLPATQQRYSSGTVILPGVQMVACTQNTACQLMAYAIPSATFASAPAVQDSHGEQPPTIDQHQSKATSVHY